MLSSLNKDIIIIIITSDIINHMDLNKLIFSLHPFI